MADIEKLLSLMGDMHRFDKSGSDKLNTLINQVAMEEGELWEDDLEDVAAAQKIPPFNSQKPIK